MTDHKYPIEVQSDFLERVSKARPVNAVAELIWNGLDADADTVAVSIDHDDMGMSAIRIRDDGDGISYDDAPKLFQRLGGSWKHPGETSRNKNRMLHGYEGRGRFKVFTLGRVADWHVTYEAENGELRAYDVTMLESNIKEVRISDEQVVIDGNTGIELVISELHREFRSLASDNATQELAEILALYLKSYRDISVTYEGDKIDPSTAIQSKEVIVLPDISNDEDDFSVELEIIEWKTATKRALYLCTEQGFPLTQVSTRFHVGNFQFSAYLKSPYITELHKEAILELGEMNPLLGGAIDEARQCIKTYFRNRAAERARHVVEEWKADDVYPFKGEANSPIEAAERKIFDILAVTASDHLADFESAPTRDKRFNLRMLRTAVERSPEDLQLILTEVLDLPKRKQEELAKLLREASLSSIITAAREVSDRLKFLAGLEAILFAPDMKAKLKERSQLHQIIADNTWLFGEEYHLTASDRSLTTVLRKHRKLLDDHTVIDKPVKHVDKKLGIVDLMFSRALRRHRADKLDHLVVELKRPSVKIGDKEITQIEKYAISVANDERFRTSNGVRWVFWVISDDFADYADYRMDEDGIISSNGGITVGVKTWGQVIEQNKARLQFFQEKLEHQVDEGTALRYLQDRYSRFLEGVVTEDDIENSDSNDE